MTAPAVDSRLVNLEAQHRDLDQAVRRLERRAYLTPPEQQEMAVLKRQKLSAKDEIAALRREP